MFHVFHLQLPSCPHSRVAHGSPAENVTFRRTARTSVRRRNLQTVHAGLFGNEKTDKEIEAHFTMFNRKSGAENDRSAEHKFGENGRASHWCVAGTCAYHVWLTRKTGAWRLCEATLIEAV